MKNIRLKKHAWTLMSILLVSLFFGPAKELRAQQLPKEMGNASYYGNALHGHKTASGERYHKDSLTCAHKTLPFGTRLHVFCPSTGKDVVVRVIDRGPYSRGRIVDLSTAAAREIGIIRRGWAPVEVTILRDVRTPFLPEPEEIPELELGISIDSVFYEPEWQIDSISARYMRRNAGISHPRK